MLDNLAKGALLAIYNISSLQLLSAFSSKLTWCHCKVSSEFCEKMGHLHSENILKTNIEYVLCTLKNFVTFCRGKKRRKKDNSTEFKKFTSTKEIEMFTITFNSFILPHRVTWRTESNKREKKKVFSTKTDGSQHQHWK